MTATSPPSPRIANLDAIRGWACLTVVFCHVSSSAPLSTILKVQDMVWLLPIIRLFSNGDAAVVIFFLLSGYVLALPFFREKPSEYGRFLFKRICRLYIPFAAVIALTASLFHIVDIHRPLEDVGPWFAEHTTLAAYSSLAGHFLMIGRLQDISLDTVTWTLVHEMRISVIFPLLVWVSRNTRMAILVALSDLVGSTILLAWLGATEPWGPDSFAMSLLWTLRMIPYFFAGILLCKHSADICAFIRRISPAKRMAVFMCAFLSFLIPHSYVGVFSDGIYVLAASILIMFPFEMRTLSRIFATHLLQGLGRISYSIYLLHIPILLALFSLMWGHYSYATMIAVFVGVLLIAAILIYGLVEAPAMWIGRHFNIRPPFFR